MINFTTIVIFGMKRVIYITSMPCLLFVEQLANVNQYNIDEIWIYIANCEILKV